MDAGPALHAFSQSLRTIEPNANDSWLRLIVSKELAEVNMLAAEWQATSCLLTDIGEFLCRATEILAQLAQRMAHGEHVHTYSKLRIKDLSRETDFSELEPLDLVNRKHSLLK